MTSAPARHRLVILSADELRARLPEALSVYVTAMAYPRGTASARSPMWLSHMLRNGWRCVAAVDEDQRLLGITYGYLGKQGQWWHDQVRTGLARNADSTTVRTWLTNYFELTELHVLPEAQGRGLGERLLRMLLDSASDTGADRVLLSTPEGPTRAWRLYRRLGFVDVLRRYYFAGDPRPFAVLGRRLPLAPPISAPAPPAGGL